MLYVVQCVESCVKRIRANSIGQTYRVPAVSFVTMGKEPYLNCASIEQTKHDGVLVLLNFQIEGKLAGCKLCRNSYK